MQCQDVFRRNMNISKRKLSQESENTDEVLSMCPLWPLAVK